MTRTTRLLTPLLLCLALSPVIHAASWHHLNDVVLFDPGPPRTQGWGSSECREAGVAMAVMG